MSRIRLTGLLVLVAACGGGRAPMTGGPGPAPTASEAVETFMQALADSNITRMGQLWGTTRGPAALTGEPSSWERQMIAVQLFLRGGTYRVASNISLGGDDHRQVTIDVDRGGCTRQVPFRVRRLAGGGWLVVDLDVSQAGNPSRPCGDL